MRLWTSSDPNLAGGSLKRSPGPLAGCEGRFAAKEKQGEGREQQRGRKERKERKERGADKQPLK